MDELHQNRINRVVDYIQANLENDLSLKQLAQIACFSEFHFDRVFKTVIGESVYQFIRRLRLEKAATLLLMDSQKSITDIAFTCGFATPSSFAKSFKNYFKMNATEWRNQSNHPFHHDSTPIQIEPGQISIIQHSPVWTFEQKGSIRQVVIEDIPPLQIAYVRKVGPYPKNSTFFNELYAQLFQWAGPRGYLNDTTMTLNIYHDSPEITEKQKLRVMVALPLEEEITPSGAVGVTKLSGGKYGVCRFLLKSDEFAAAWDWMYSIWLLNSWYEQDDREAFERCFGEKTIAGTRHFEVDICVPVKAK